MGALVSARKNSAQKNGGTIFTAKAQGTQREALSLFFLNRKNPEYSFATFVYGRVYASAGYALAVQRFWFRLIWLR
jgi:hypothetical protein